MNHTIYWGFNQQVGYRRTLMGTEALHDQIEDVGFPNLKSSKSSNPMVFVLADGHGGPNASTWFVEEAQKRFTELVNMKKWNIKNAKERQEIQSHIYRVYADLDIEYRIIQEQKYKSWDGQQSLKPVDDGCTLVVNLVLDGWIINCNVGDSRTVVAVLKAQENASHIYDDSRKESYYERYILMERIISSTDNVAQNETEEINPSSQNSTSKVEASLPSPPASPQSELVSNKNNQQKTENNELQISLTNPFHYMFGSADHNMTHPAKIHHIQSNGGLFMFPQNGSTRMRFVKSVKHPRENGFRPYSELVGTRVYREATSEMRMLKVSHWRTLNLSATMGDIAFKFAGEATVFGVIDATPDIRFIELQANEDYMIIMGTDGVWDHLQSQRSQEGQNRSVISFVNQALIQEANQLETIDGEKLQNILHSVAGLLVNRENEESGDMFARGMSRYDDASAYILYLKT